MKRTNTSLLDIEGISLEHLHALLFFLDVGHRGVYFLEGLIIAFFKEMLVHYF